jgi:superfamily II DNA or RNA helicase
MSELALAPLTPYPHQEDALAAMSVARDEGISSYLIESAPGTGKTLTAAERAVDHLARDSGNRVLYLCQRTGLLKYAHSTFTRQIDGEVSSGFIGSRQRTVDGQITFAMLQSMYHPHDDTDAFYKTIDPEAYSLVVVDEAQHGPAPTYREVIEHFQPDERLSMSGVPYRHDGLNLNAMLGPTVYRKTLPESITQGLVTPMRYHLYDDRLDAVIDIEDLAQPLSPGMLNRLFFLPWRDEKMLSIVGDEASEIDNLNGMMFCKSIKHAEHMAQLARKILPYSVQPIHSQQSAREQEYHTDALRDGELELATVVGMFDEGIDLPRLNFIALFSDTASEGLWLNKIGRVLRLHPGKDRAYIADFTSSLQRIRQVDKLHTLVSAEQEKPETRSTRKRNLYPEAEFVFSREVIDIIARAKTIRKSVKLRQAELDLDKQEHPTPMSIPLSLTMPSTGRDKAVPVSPSEGTILAYIFEAGYGAMDEKTLRQVCRTYFSWIPSSLGAMMEDLASEDFISRVSSSGDGMGPSHHWRLTEQTIEGFLNIESYKQTHKEELNLLIWTIESVEREGLADSRIKYHEEEEGSGRHFVVRPHRNRLPFEGIDFTEAELGAIGLGYLSGPVDARHRSIRVKESYEVHLDYAETIMTLHQGTSVLGKVKRRMTPAQMAVMRDDINDIYPPQHDEEK